MDTETDTAMDSETAIETDTEADSETATETDNEMDAETDTATDTDTSTETDTETDTLALSGCTLAIRGRVRITRNTIREDLQNKQCREVPGCDAVLRFIEVNSKIFSTCLSLAL